MFVPFLTRKIKYCFPYKRLKVRDFGVAKRTQNVEGHDLKWDMRDRECIIKAGSE